jgi:hypothetical protein
MNSSMSKKLSEVATRFLKPGVTAFGGPAQRDFSHDAKDRKRQELEAESGGDRASPTMSQEQM